MEKKLIKNDNIIYIKTKQTYISRLFEHYCFGTIFGASDPMHL